MRLTRRGRTLVEIGLIMAASTFITLTMYGVLIWGLSR